MRMQTQMDRNPTSFMGQLIRDLFLVAMLALVTVLIGICSIVRAARVIGLLPHKEASEPC